MRRVDPARDEFRAVELLVELTQTHGDGGVKLAADGVHVGKGVESMDEGETDPVFETQP